MHFALAGGRCDSLRIDTVPDLEWESIGDAAECYEAAIHLGIARSPRIIDSNAQPPGCVWQRNTPPDYLFFNVRVDSVDNRFDQQRLCRKYDFHPLFMRKKRIAPLICPIWRGR